MYTTARAHTHTHIGAKFSQQKLHTLKSKIKLVEFLVLSWVSLLLANYKFLFILNKTSFGLEVALPCLFLSIFNYVTSYSQPYYHSLPIQAPWDLLFSPPTCLILTSKGQTFNPPADQPLFPSYPPSFLPTLQDQTLVPNTSIPIRPWMEHHL
jgi:hypothetical protein